MLRFKSLSFPLAVALTATVAAFGAPAAAVATSPASAVVLNEVNCEGTDWIELVNTSDSAVDVSGWLLSDDAVDRNPPRSDHRYLFPSGTTIVAQSRLVVEKVTGGFPFGVSCGGDTIRLADGAAGSLHDEFVVPVTAAPGDTWGRVPDGTGPWVETTPTEGSVNEASAAGGGTPPDPSWLFDPGAVQVIDLTLPQATIDALNATYGPTEDYYDATFSITRTGGQTYGPLAVGVRLKGGGSFRTLAGKAAFKVKFNHSVAGQRFQGLKKLTLNNMIQDKSMVHETLAYATFRAAGVPAPRTGFAFVRVNGGEFGVYLDVETLDDVALPHLFTSTKHLYEGEYTDDVRPGAAASFGVDEGSDSNRADLEALIAAVNGGGSFSAQVGTLADIPEMTRQWAVERYIAHWDGYAGWDDSAYRDIGPYGGFSPNNYFLHSDASGRFSMLPWGADQTWGPLVLPEGIRPVGFDDGTALMFTRCLADPACGALYRNALDAVASRMGTLGLDKLADDTAALLRPWQVQDLRRETTLAEIDAAVAGVHEFMRVRAVEAAAWLTPPVVIGVPDRAPNGAGWYAAPVTIDWQATDTSSPATDPPDTIASTEGASVGYSSGPSCDTSYNCAKGSLSLSIDLLGPSLAPTITPATILLHGTATTTPNATDTTSRVSTQSCGSVDTSTAGAHTLTCTATDNAGNSTTTSVAYVVQYKMLGFFSPTSNAKWKGGQTVPIKIALGDANGIRIADSAAQALLSPTCRVTFVAAGAQAASACMKYDTANHQFTYSWKLGQPIGAETIGVRIGYPGTSTTTVLSEPIAITK